MTDQEEPFWKKTLQRVTSESDKDININEERLVQSQKVSPMHQDIPIDPRNFENNEEQKHQIVNENLDSTPARSSTHSRQNLPLDDAAVEQSKENSFERRPEGDSENEVNRKYISKEELDEIQRKSDTDFSKNVSHDHSMAEPTSHEPHDLNRPEQIDEKKVTFRSIPSEERKSETERLPTFENNKDIDAAVEENDENIPDLQYYEHQQD